jgi:hypothetical protein
MPPCPTSSIILYLSRRTIPGISAWFKRGTPLPLLHHLGRNSGAIAVQVPVFSYSLTYCWFLVKAAPVEDVCRIHIRGGREEFSPE